MESIVGPDCIMGGLGYDGAGRGNTLSFDRGALTYRYSPTSGNLEGIRAPAGDSIVFSYDGSLPTAARWVGPVAGQVAVSYNDEMRVASQTVDGANTANFIYSPHTLFTKPGPL